MADIIKGRKQKIAERIKEERRKKYKSQEAFSNDLADLLHIEVIKQATISDWENGNTFPPIDRLIAMSKLFGCDLGYLLCDYDARTHGVNEICAETGLSPESVERLRYVNTWGIRDDSLNVIDFLIRDHYAAGPRSILSLIYFFLKFDGTKAGIPKRIFTDGSIVDTPDPAAYTENSFSIASNRVIENAVLDEIKENLITRKNAIKEASNNG